MIESSNKQTGTFPIAHRIAGAVVFAIVWTLGRAWWSGDYTIGKFIFVASCVALAGLVWVWIAQRFRFMR